MWLTRSIEWPSRTLNGGAMGAAAGLLGGYLYDQQQKGNID
jgi:hypothetical protein